MGVGCNEIGNVNTVKHFWHIHIITVTMLTFGKQNINGNNSSNNNHRNRYDEDNVRFALLFVNTPKNAHGGFCLILPCHPCGFLHRNAKWSCDICSQFYRQCVEQPPARNCTVSFSGTYSFLF